MDHVAKGERMGISELTGPEEVNDVHCEQLHLKLGRRAIYPSIAECNMPS